jgi:hypothetical protein
LPSSRSARGSRCWSSRRRAPCRRGSVCRGARSDDLERTDSETADPTVRRYAEVLISPNSSFERAFGTDGPPTAGRATQGMGPIGETIRRTWQLAHVMKGRRVGTRDENARVLRYLGKYMVEPALVHGVANDVGSLAPGQGIARARCHRGRRPAQGSWAACWLHTLRVPDPRLHVAVADLLEARRTNHPVEQMDGVVLRSGAGEGAD